MDFDQAIDFIFYPVCIIFILLIIVRDFKKTRREMSINKGYVFMLKYRYMKMYKENPWRFDCDQ